MDIKFKFCLFILLILFSGCSNSQITANNNVEYEKNLYLTGYLDYEEDYSIYFKESNSSKKYALIDCEENYALKFKEEITLRGFFTNVNANTYFYCGDYDLKKETLEKEYSKLLQNNSKLEKTQENLISNIKELNKTIVKLNSTKNHMISEINFLTDNYTISQIEKDFRAKTKHEGPYLNIELVEALFGFEDPYDIKENCGKNKGCGRYTDYYYDVSEINESYGIYFIGNRTEDSEVYIEHRFWVEREE